MGNCLFSQSADDLSLLNESEGGSLPGEPPPPYEVSSPSTEVLLWEFKSKQCNHVTSVKSTGNKSYQSKPTRILCQQVHSFGLQTYIRNYEYILGIFKVLLHIPIPRTVWGGGVMFFFPTHIFSHIFSELSFFIFQWLHFISWCTKFMFHQLVCWLLLQKFLLQSHAEPPVPHCTHLCNLYLFTISLSSVRSFLLCFLVLFFLCFVLFF